MSQDSAEEAQSTPKWPDGCEHCGVKFKYDPDFDDDGTYYDDGVIFCESCRKAVAVRCPACGGEGVVEENEYESDWVNYGPDLITCPECDGDCYVADPMWQ